MAEIMSGAALIAGRSFQPLTYQSINHAIPTPTMIPESEPIKKKGIVCSFRISMVP